MEERNKLFRLKKFKQEKDIISIWRKKIKLLDAKRGMNKVELEKPLRWGYKKFFVLREDVAKGPDANVYLGILPYVQTTIYSRRKDFLKKDFKTKKMVDMEFSIGSISHTIWNTLEDVLTVKQKSLFIKMWYTRNKNPKIGEWRYYLQKDWMFVPKVDVHYKTHELILDPDLESELAEINNKIYSNGLLPKLRKILNWSSYRDWDNMKQKLIDKYYADEAHLIVNKDADNYMDSINANNE